MQKNGTTITALIASGIQVKLKDKHITHQVEDTGCSCFISHKNILVRGEYSNESELSRTAMVTLTDPRTGKSKGTQSVYSTLRAELTIWPFRLNLAPKFECANLKPRSGYYCEFQTHFFSRILQASQRDIGVLLR